MAFRTKIDYSSNRQIRQTEQTETQLNGKTILGMPISGLTSGANVTSAVIVSSYENVISSFSGTSTATTYNFGITEMIAGESGLNVINLSNYNDGQEIDEPLFIGVSGSTNPTFGNTVYAYYQGVTFDLEVTSFNNLGGGVYSGTLISEIVTIYTATTMDYSGDGTWLEVLGKTKTERILVEDSLVIPTYTPTATADINGVIGDIAYDNSYIYIKTAAGWKRSGLSTF